MNYRQTTNPRVIVKLVLHQKSQNLSSYIYTLKLCHEINLTIFYVSFLFSICAALEANAELHVFINTEDGSLVAGSTFRNKN